MINTVSKRCLYEDCTKHRTYGLADNKPTHCSEHKTNEMIDVINKKCLYEHCDKHPSFGLVDETPTHCFQHKLDEMINVKSKTCLHEGCDKQCSFGLIGEKHTHCFEHKLDKMINVKNKKCLNEDCNKIPSFGIIDEKPTHCSEHKTNEMIDVVHKKCLHEDCKKNPCYGLKYGNPIHCSEHKTEKMINVVSKKCISCNLFITKKKNQYLCSYCNPNKQEKTKRKEIIIKELLENNNLTFIHDRQIKNDCCLKYRPDFLFDCKTYFVILEVDEDAHESYPQECEIIRMNNLASGLGLPTLFIRYNPDKTGIKQKEKHQILLKILNENLNLEYLIDPTPIYLFYLN